MSRQGGMHVKHVSPSTKRVLMLISGNNLCRVQEGSDVLPYSISIEYHP